MVKVFLSPEFETVPEQSTLILGGKVGVPEFPYAPQDKVAWMSGCAKSSSIRALFRYNTGF